MNTPIAYSGISVWTLPPAAIRRNHCQRQDTGGEHLPVIAQREDIRQAVVRGQHAG